MDMMDEVNEYAALLAEIATLQAKANEMQRRVHMRAAMAVRAIMVQHNLTEEQVMSGWAPATRAYKPRDPSKVQPIRYRDDAGNTWSGMGRAPAWIASAPDRSVFRVA